jgi:hypothetical protein
MVIYFLQKHLGRRIILFLNLMISLKIFPNNFVERKEVQILFKKCKLVSQKKILEISLDIYMKKLDDLCDEVKYLKSIQDVE